MNAEVSFVLFMCLSFTLPEQLSSGSLSKPLSAFWVMKDIFIFPSPLVGRSKELSNKVLECF